MTIVKPTNEAKVPMSFKISQYVKNNPNAKPADIAKELGTTTAYVYVVVSKLKRGNGKKSKATITKKAIDARLKLAKIEGEKKMVRVFTAEGGKSITAHVDQITNLTPEQYQRLAENLGQGRKRLETATQDKPDNVNHPAHYKVGGMETIDFIEAKGLGYNLGNVIKYITRADHKGSLIEDLKKARWYLNREISKLDGAEN